MSQTIGRNNWNFLDVVIDHGILQDTIVDEVVSLYCEKYERSIMSECTVSIADNSKNSPSETKNDVENAKPTDSSDVFSEILILPQEVLSQRWYSFLARTCPNYKKRIEVRSTSFNTLTRYLFGSCPISLNSSLHLKCLAVVSTM